MGIPATPTGAIPREVRHSERAMTLPPRTHLGWSARIALWVVSLVPALGVYIALGLAFGPWIASFAFVLSALAMAYAHRRGLKLRRVMKSDPPAAFRTIDRGATREGKLYAAISFVTIGVGVIAIIVVFATRA